MKDYSLGVSTKFILSYEIANGKIAILYNDNRVEYLPYTCENEQLIISQMEQQVIKYRGNFDIAKKDEWKMFKLLYGYDLIEPSILVLLTTLSLIPGLNLLSLVLAYLSANAGIKFLSKLERMQQISKDYEKSSLFLENKEALLGKKDNDWIDEFIRDVRVSIGDDNELSINNLDKISLQQLKTMIQNLNVSHDEVEPSDGTKVFKI